MDARDEHPPVCPHCGSIMIVFNTKQSTEEVAVCLKCWAAITLPSHDPTSSPENGGSGPEA